MINDSMTFIEGIVLKLNLISIYILFIFLPKIDPKASDKSKKQMQSDAKAEKQQQASGSGLASLPTSYQVATAPTRIHPRIDATDRRQIEAQNEDRSHTTKETLDDIKRIHYKEKKKKEQNCNSEPYQTEIQLGGWVSLEKLA